MSKITIIGSGLIGSSWAVVFSRAGHEVCLYDQTETPFDFSRRYITEEVSALTQLEGKACPADPLQSIRHTTNLVSAIDGAIYIQESVLEKLEVKQELFAALDPMINDQVVLASSSSGIPASRFTEKLKHRAQCLVAHPVNPPHLIPLVEVVPAPWTDEAVVQRTHALMAEIGQSPVRVDREIEGFILNRLQGALLNEAWWLYEEGYASVEEIDRTVRDGLSPRWSFMGPFQTIDLNAPGGLVDYAERLAPLYYAIAQSRSNPTPWQSEAIRQAGEEIEAFKQRFDRPDPQGWRNAILRSFKCWRQENDSEPKG